MSDLIERQAAIDMFQNLAYDDWNQGVSTTWANAYSEAVEMIRDLPSAQPEITLESAIDYLNSIGWMQNHDREMTEYALRTDEWCTDCKEYDHERNCCPRFNHVIRAVLQEVQPERKKGRWITHEYLVDGYKHAYCECTACGGNRPITLFPLRFCPNCGAEMEV